MRHDRMVPFAAAIALSCAGLYGCHEEGEMPASAVEMQPAAPEPEPERSRQTSAGGGAALGGAQRAARGVASDLEHRSQQIADEADDY